MLLICVALALVLCAPVAAPASSAQGSARVLCEAIVGFNGVAREGRFAPVILSIENPGARMIARISLSVTWGGLRGPPPGRTITREAVLDEGATSRFPFVIPLPRNVRAVHASVTSQGVEVGSLDIETRSLTTQSRIVVGISSDLSLDAVSALGGSDGSLRVVYPRLDDLPRSWPGYDGVDAVIVHDTYFRQLRSDQLDAIQRWVLGGGVLVFTGGAAALQHQSAGFGDLLPVQVNGLTQREGISVPVGGGEPRRLPGSVELADAQVTAGKILAAAGTIPLMVQRRLGRGTVWFLAFDPTAPQLARWDGLLSLWRSILSGDRLPAAGLASKPAMEDPWIAAVFAAAAVSFPPVYAVLAFVGAYLALLAPLLLAGTRGGIRSRTRLALLGAVCIAATTAGWSLFNRVLFDPGLQIIDAARVDARSGDGLALVTEKIGFYAASARPVEARLGGSDAVVETAALRTPQNLPLAEPHLLLLQAASGVLVRGIDVERLGARLLVVQDPVPFDVTARVGVSGSSIQTFVSNGSSKPLLGCYMLVSGRAFPLGDVAAGAAVQRTFVVSDGAESSAADVMFQSDSRRAALFKAQEGDGPQPGPSRLIGWMDGPIIPIAIPGSRQVGGVPGLALVSVEAE
ncbi:MAG: hypothetical protein ABSG38_15830 [Spirochaetia bacterium]|jgi:hypothetical protein